MSNIELVDMISVYQANVCRSFGKAFKGVLVEARARIGVIPAFLPAWITIGMTNFCPEWPLYENFLKNPILF